MAAGLKTAMKPRLIARGKQKQNPSGSKCWHPNKAPAPLRSSRRGGAKANGTVKY